jgi:hypothetical protein
VAVAVLLALGASGAHAKNYERAAATTARQLANADSRADAKRALMRLMRTSNVTVLGKRGGRARVLVRGFADSPRDLFFVEPQIDALARVARGPARPPVGHLALPLTQLAGKPVAGEQVAKALRKWIAQARRGSKRNPGVYVPRVIDRLARRRGVNLAKADPGTRLSGIEMFLAQMTLAPGRPRGARGSVVQAGGVCTDLLEGDGIASFAARNLGGFVVRFIDSLLPPYLTVRSITAAAVALGTDVRLDAGSEPLEGRATPIHWQHDEDAEPQTARFKLLFVNDLPIPSELSACLRVAGIDAPPQGGRRAGIPVAWWLDDGTPSVPEMAGQTMRMQGKWERESPASSLSGVAGLLSPLTGGRLLDVTESGADGVSTMKLTPRREKGPHPGDDATIDGTLLAVPFTAGTEIGVQQVANLISAVVRNQEFKVPIAHHVKVGWRFAAPTRGQYQADCVPEGCDTYDYEFTGMRCALTDQVAPSLDPSTPRNEPVGLAGNWYAFTGGRVIITNADGGSGTAPYRPVFVVPEVVGDSAGIGTLERGTVSAEDGGAHIQTRLADTPGAGHLRIDYHNDQNGQDGVYGADLLDTDEVEVVPISDANELPLDYPCQRTELLTEP